MTEEQKLKKASYNLWTFVTSKMISSFGAQVTAFAISFYILSVTGSATSFAMMLICNIIPRVILSPFAGYFVDTYSKKKIVITAQIVATITLFSAFFISEFYGFEIWYFYAITMILGICGTFSGLAFTSSISSLVNSERLQKAMSLNQMSISFSAIGAPILGSIIYGYIEIPTFVLIYAIASLMALILESTMNFKLYSTIAQTSKEKVWDSITKGIVYLKEKQLILTIILVALIINFLFGAFEIGYSYVLVEKLKLTSEALGTTNGAFASGMLIMSIYLSTRKPFEYPLVIVRRFIILSGLFFILIPLPLLLSMSATGNIAYYLVVMFLFGGNLILINMPIGVMMQKTIDEEFKGRVFSIMDTFGTALIPIGMILFGFLFDMFPATYVFIINGIVIMGTMAYMLRGSVLKKAQLNMEQIKVEQTA